MQFPQQLVTEITAPNTVPFQPGNNVTGIGSSVPPELAAAGFTNAIVVYSSDWNALNTNPTIKFRFIATNGGALTLGVGYCANPSANATAIVLPVVTVGMFFGNLVGDPFFSILSAAGPALLQAFSGDGSTLYGASKEPFVGIYYADGNPMLVLQTTTSGDPVMNLYAPFTGGSSKKKITFSYTASNGQSQFNFRDGGFGIYSLDSDSTAKGYCNGFILRETGWQDAASNLQMVNGWSSDPANPIQYRLCSTGEVMWKGHATKTTAPTNGENWITGISSLYRPLAECHFLVASQTRTYNGTQKVVITATGAGQIWDAGASTGDIVVSPVHYPNLNVT